MMHPEKETKKKPILQSCDVQFGGVGGEDDSDLFLGENAFCLRLQRHFCLIVI